MNYNPPPPKPPAVFNRQLQDSLFDALGSDLQEKLKARQVKQKYQGYESPKPPKRNEGMNGPKGEVFL